MGRGGPAALGLPVGGRRRCERKGLAGGAWRAGGFVVGDVAVAVPVHPSHVGVEVLHARAEADADGAGGLAGGVGRGEEGDRVGGLVDGPGDGDHHGAGGVDEVDGGARVRGDAGRGGHGARDRCIGQERCILLTAVALKAERHAVALNISIFTLKTTVKVKKSRFKRGSLKLIHDDT